jgi:septal ring factor EnvC (AmiA/AmiB activator)
VHTPSSVRSIVRQGVAAVTVSVFAAGLLIGVTARASATPRPTLSQVQAKLSKLQSQLRKLDQQYDQVKQELAATDQRLALVNKQAAAYGARFASLRQQIGRIAVTAYEDGNLNSSVALLTSGKPQQILNQSSILLELSAANNAQINQFLAAAKQLTSTQLLDAPRSAFSSCRPDSASAGRRCRSWSTPSSPSLTSSRRRSRRRSGLPWVRRRR